MSIRRIAPVRFERAGDDKYPWKYHEVHRQVGVVQFGTNDRTAEGFCYVLSTSWPYVTERAQVIEGSTAYTVFSK